MTSMFMTLMALMTSSPRFTNVNDEGTIFNLFHTSSSCLDDDFIVVRKLWRHQPV